MKRKKIMQRREFLRKTVIGTLGSVSAMGIVSGRDNGEAPNGKVKTETVSMFAPRDDPRVVNAGSWLIHRWSWIDLEGGDSTEEDVQRYLDSVELSIQIDGEEIENPDQYWGNIHRNEEGKYIVHWKYKTPPKSTGLHTFSVEVSFPDGYEDLAPADEDALQMDVPVGFRKLYTGHYKVTAGRGKK